jgi:hypothetical protein
VFDWEDDLEKPLLLLLVLLLLLWRLGL